MDTCTCKEGPLNDPSKLIIIYSPRGKTQWYGRKDCAAHGIKYIEDPAPAASESEASK